MVKDPNEGARLLRLARETGGHTQIDIDKMVAEALGRTGKRRRTWGGSVSRYESGERKPDAQVSGVGTR